MMRSCHQKCSVRKAILRNFTKFTGKHVSLFEACNFIKKETLTHVFSCEFCEISKNTFSTEHLRATDSVWFLSQFADWVETWSPCPFFTLTKQIYHTLITAFINCQSCYYLETSHLLCCANQ